MGLSSIVSVCFFLFIFLFIFFIRPSNKWHNLAMCKIQTLHIRIILLSLLATMLICILPMSLSPYWNGTLKIAADMQQYGRLADALLEGHLYIDNGNIDPALEAMENPYDTDARKKLGINFHWDEVYYNHHYYTYFGIVPTIILFIPFKLLTGTMLLSYQATQIFAAFSIIGTFYLFYVSCRLFFPQLPFSIYLLLSTALSVLSIGYSIAAPALYCTAIVSAICLMQWSMIFFLRGAWDDDCLNVSKRYFLIGGILGAMAFGCRPPVALGNIVIIAIVLRILNNINIIYKEKIKILISLLMPYFVVGALLMLYNYARFGNVFEFGVSYQLTVTDQHLYQNFNNRFDVKRLFSGVMFLLFSYQSLDTFPYVMLCGLFMNFPIFFLIPHIFSKAVTSFLKVRKIYTLVLLLFCVPFLIAIIDVYWTPFPHPRYQLDFCYLLCIVTFISSAGWVMQLKDNKRLKLNYVLVILSFLTIATQFLLFCVPFDGSLTDFNPEVLEQIRKGIFFWY